MHLYTHRGAEGGLGPDHAHHQQAHQGAAKALSDQPTYEHTIQNFNPPSQYLTHIWVAICEQQLVGIHNIIYTCLSHPPRLTGELSQAKRMFTLTGPDQNKWLEPQHAALKILVPKMVHIIEELDKVSASLDSCDMEEANAMATQVQQIEAPTT